MEMIDLSQNSFTESLPNDTSPFLRLIHLNLSHSALVGPLPLLLGTYSRIRTIDLGFNLLNGPLLTNLFTSPILAHLHLSRNNFTGRMPLQDIQPIGPATLRAVNQYSPLESLDLSYNQLNGFIPREIGVIDSLRSLNLAGNQFSGNVHLFLPLVSGLPGGRPETNGRGRHEKGLGVDIKAIIIGVCTAGSALLVGLALFLYYRRKSSTQHLNRYVHFREKVNTKDRNRGQPSNAGHYEFHRDVDPSPPVPLKFSADNLLAPEKRLTAAEPKGLTTAAAVQETSNVKAKGIESMKTSSIDISSSSEHPIILNVQSPDRLAGDLFFLNNTLSFTAEELSRAPAEVLVRSNHGNSYKATLDNGHVLRVKWLKEGLAKNKNEFAREAKKFANIRHPNLVSLRVIIRDKGSMKNLFYCKEVKVCRITSYSNL